MQTGEWHYNCLTYSGLSLAGIRTSITIPELSVCFDVAQGLPHAIPMNTFLITHGHQDHAAGIPYIISQKSMNSHRPPKFLMPEVMIEPMNEIMRQWERIEGHSHEFEFIPAITGSNYPLKGNHFVRPFETVHKITSQGYSIGRSFRKLRADLVGKPSEEIRALKESGIDPTEERQELLVSFTGDTQIEFLERSPEVRNSKVLLMEATYFDEKRSVVKAREWGHTHIDEIVPVLSSIKSEKIVLIHSSARYDWTEVLAILRRKIPEHEQARIVLFPGR